MKQLLKSKKFMFILFLIILVSGLETSFGSRFFHDEMARQINETLKAQATQIIQGYETYDQNSEILRAGIQADALELNRIHGEFLIRVMSQSYQDRLHGKINDDQMESRIISIIGHSEEQIDLKGDLIWNAYARRSDLAQLIRNAVQEPNQNVSFLGNNPSEIYRTGFLDVVIRGGAERPWETYARAVYYQPLDLIVIIAGTSSYAEDNVARLFKHNQENLERNIMMIGSMEDVIIFQKSGYSLYSGRFEEDRSRRVTRIAYDDVEDPYGLGKQITGNSGIYKTLQVKTPDQHMQERYSYIEYDGHQDQYVIVSRSTDDILSRERAMNLISLLVGTVNVIVVSLIAFMILSRDETLKEEAGNS